MKLIANNKSDSQTYPQDTLAFHLQMYEQRLKKLKQTEHCLAKETLDQSGESSQDKSSPQQ